MSEDGNHPGYAGKFLRVNLSTGVLSDETWEDAELRKWVGGSGVGVKILYHEVSPQIDWDSPDNRLIMATGPLAGTSVMGTGTVSFVTKGAITGGATTTQANGFMGAFLKFAGYDGVVIHGRSDRWVYLYLHDGVAELRDAEHLLGLDTYDLQDRVSEELGKSEKRLSVLGIGPAGENLVRFAAIAGDKGHVAGHNGVGAVMGSKRLKAIVAERGDRRFPIFDDALLKTKARLIIEEIQATPASKALFDWGTSMVYSSAVAAGWLPIKNYTTNLFPEAERFIRTSWQDKWKLSPAPCWACRTKHLHNLTITDGKYAGFSGEEPEYEQWASWGSLVGQTDPAAAVVLSVEVDRLGMDTNEASWITSWVMECYEKGILTKEDTNGLEMTWGNTEAMLSLLRMIARRQGFGDVLADGIKRACQKVGRGSEDLAIYSEKGNTPRGHDHRAKWPEMVDTCVSDTSTIEVGPPYMPEEQGGSAVVSGYDWRDIGDHLGRHNGRMMFEDTLGMCRFCSRTSMANLGQTVEAATGFKGFSGEEALAVGRRISNLLRVFNLRCGLTPEMERPSKRYGSVCQDGPAAGKDIMENWDGMRRKYYDLMGWDFNTGKPLPETLSTLGLDSVVPDIWEAPRA